MRMSREKAIQFGNKWLQINKYWKGNSTYAFFQIAIKALEQEPRWIPVSERLPDNSGNYLVSVIDGSGEDDDYEAVDVAWFAHKKDYNIKESKWQELGVDETIIAWMPLPKPYEPQESEDNNG